MLDVQWLIAAAELGDPQRNPRVHTLVLDLIRGAGAGTDGAATAGTRAPHAHTIGAFRFFNNPAITLPALYDIVRAGLREAVAPGARAYVLHDVSVVDFSSHHAKRDRRVIGNGHGDGYELCTALVLDADGRPLGPVAQALRTADGVWSSDAVTLQPDIDHHAQYVAHVAAAAAHLPGRWLIHVIDREGDDVWLQRALTSAVESYVIRAQHLRRTVRHRGLEVPLAAAVAGVSLAFSHVVARPGVGAGDRAQLWLGETTVTFAGKSWRGRHRGETAQAGPAIDVRVIVAELRGDGTTDRWILLTNLTEPAVDVVQAYVWRWRIERLFYFIKVGFRLEGWNQQTGDAIARRLALASLAAMALHQLRAATTDAATEPAAAAALREVAAWGGHIGRADAAPGPIVLLRGLMVLIGAIGMIDQYGVEGIRAQMAHVQSIVRLDFTPMPMPGAKRYPKGGV